MLPASGRADADDRAHGRAVERVRRALSRHGAPRALMTLMVVLTGLAGLGASAALRRAGLHHPGVRYGLAVLAAYGAFLALLGLWLLMERRRARRGGSGRHATSSLLDLDPSPSAGGWGGGARAPLRWGGAGGRSGGGGATGVVDLPGAGPGDGAASLARAAPARPGFLGRISGGALDGLDDDALIAIVLTLVALLGAGAAAAYVIYAAPLLLADVLVDGTLSAGLYRRLRRGHEHAWWEGAIRRTILPACAVAVAFTAAGFAVHHAWPEATTLGEAWRALLGSSP